MRGTDHHIVVPCRKVAARPRRLPPFPRRQRGVFAILSAVLILVILGFCGFAIDLGRMYNRKVELQTAADTLALAAAKELDGTDAGVQRAITAANQAANTIFYDYNNSTIVWTDAAIRFGATPYGTTWLEAGAAKQPENAASMFFVQIDTSRLTTSPSNVRLTLLRFLPAMDVAAQVNSTAIAGRSSINVLPFALCAMSETPGADRGGELVEYGFRRGVNYDLMQLNPKSNTKGANYLINPLALAGTTGTSVKGRMDVVRPFVCTGTLAIPSLGGGNITVEPDFPLDALYQQLNSRFGSYTAPCNSTTAPPDINVKEFSFSSEFPWMKAKPKAQSAEVTKTATRLLTIADLTPDQFSTAPTPDMYGPLWVYAPAVSYADYTDGVAEPAGGYATFSPSDWASLYTPSAPEIKSGESYPWTPYESITEDPPGGVVGIEKRRVLQVPLLRCPVPSGSPATAEVLAIGKFFMTVKATDKALYAEFAGVAPRTALAGKVELY